MCDFRSEIRNCWIVFHDFKIGFSAFKIPKCFRVLQNWPFEAGIPSKTSSRFWVSVRCPWLEITLVTSLPSRFNFWQKFRNLKEKILVLWRYASRNKFWYSFCALETLQSVQSWNYDLRGLKSLHSFITFTYNIHMLPNTSTPTGASPSVAS